LYNYCIEFFRNVSGGRLSEVEGVLASSTMIPGACARGSVETGRCFSLALFFVMSTAVGLHPAAAQEPSTQEPVTAVQDGAGATEAPLPEVVVTTAPKPAAKSKAKAKKTIKRAGAAQKSAPQAAPAEVTEQIGS